MVIEGGEQAGWWRGASPMGCRSGCSRSSTCMHKHCLFANQRLPWPHALALPSHLHFRPPWPRAQALPTCESKATTTVCTSRGPLPARGCSSTSSIAPRISLHSRADVTHMDMGGSACNHGQALHWRMWICVCLREIAHTHTHAHTRVLKYQDQAQRCALQSTQGQLKVCEDVCLHMHVHAPAEAHAGASQLSVLHRINHLAGRGTTFHCKSKPIRACMRALQNHAHKYTHHSR